MPKQTTHIGVVREWLTSLGILAAVSLSREEANMRLGAFTPMLLDRFPDAAFTSASLQYVASRAVKGFPTYGELAQWLHDWWQANRPPVLALAPPEPIRQRGEPTPDEIAHVERIVAETIAFLRSSEQPEADRPRRGALHLTAAQLDIVNPLPNGRKRSDGNPSAAASDQVVEAAR